MEQDIFPFLSRCSHLLESLLRYTFSFIPDLWDAEGAKDKHNNKKNLIKKNNKYIIEVLKKDI